MSSPGNTHNGTHRTHPVAVHMTSVNGTVHKIDRSLDDQDGETHTRPQSRRSRSRSRSRSNSQSRPARQQNNDVTPLLDAELIPVNPSRNPEPLGDDDDDIDVGYSNSHNGSRSGVDDSFFPSDVSPTLKPRIGGDEPDANDRRIDIPEKPPTVANGDVPTSRRPSASFPYAPGFPGTGIQVFSDGEEAPRIIPDVNVYQQKKNLAQGMMDLALISANANQLRYVLEASDNHPYYYFSVIFISFSLIVQVAVGIGLILNSRYNVKNQDDICKADKINNMTIIGIFLITIVNVFIASFGVADNGPRIVMPVPAPVMAIPAATLAP